MTENQEVKKLLAPGEIKLSWCQRDWPLTPLGSRKNAYLTGWQNSPSSIEEIQAHMLEGSCKAVGLISGPCFNLPYGLIWVDVDGPSVHGLVEALAHTEYCTALPATLTICSGKDGRERRLYKIAREQQQILARNKYVWRSDTEGEKLEILWKNMQGALMGLHPETEGYYTPPGLGFEWGDKLPDLPEWILECITEKNVRQGLPMVQTTTVAGPNFTIKLEKNVERDIQLAIDALWAFPTELADDYSAWIKIGQCLHSIDDSLMEHWDSWSQQSDKYEPGGCQSKWHSFKNEGGRGLGTLVFMHKELGTGFTVGPSEDDFFGVSDENLDLLAMQFEAIQNELHMNFQETQELKEILGQHNEMLREHDDFIGMEEVHFDDKSINSDYADQDDDQQYGGGGGRMKRNPPASQIRNILIKKLEGNIVFNSVEERFYFYGYEHQGLWSPLYDIDVKGIISDLLDEIELPRGYSSSMINDLFQMIANTTRKKYWDLEPHLLNFRNGVLDPATMNFVPHHKDLLSTSQLPYDYNPIAECPKVQKWLSFTQWEDQERVQLLRAWLRAVLLSRPELQIFMELIGAANAGKSSFSNLCSALVGFSNTFATNLDQLEKNQFEPAGCYNKKLVTMADASRYGGKVVVLKQLLGQDAIPLEKKYQKEKHQFYFRGMIITTANEPIQVTDLTSGMLRRRITVPFTRQFRGDTKEYKTLINFNDRGIPYGEFSDELPGLVNWLLEMDEDTMIEYLKNPGSKVKYIQEIRSEQIIENNPIMEWLDAKTVFDPGAHTWLGDKKEGSGKDYYLNTDQYLYASYCDFCKKTNVMEMSRRRFIVILADICKDQLKIDIKRMTTKNRWIAYQGLALRNSNGKYSDYPSLVEYGLHPHKYSYIYGEIVDVEVLGIDRPLLDEPHQYSDPYPESVF